VEGAAAAAHEAARIANCEVAIASRWRYPAVAMSIEPKDALRRAVASLGLEPRELPSGAGHDAAIFALAGVPSAMLFVRSDAGGVSHAPEECSGADAVALGVQALEAALRELAA
jgi:acetylornithine deacetylase/succinyl-diaminopimelate desuccinylase-like protein